MCPHRSSLSVWVSLQLIESAWSETHLAWGPAGSVGFELATGEHTASPESDLDLVIFSPRQTERPVLSELWRRAQDMPCKIDIRVETAIGSFALEEFVRERGRPILIRTMTGPRLCSNPWKEEPR